MGQINELLHQKVHVSALNMPAITQCKLNQQLKSCNNKLLKKTPATTYCQFHNLLSYIKGVNRSLLAKVYS